MLASSSFIGKSRSFWACVRWVGNELGYAKNKEIVVPTSQQIRECIANTSDVDGSIEQLEMCEEVREYLLFRKEVLNGEVQYLLQNAEEAEEMYQKIRSTVENTNCPLPMNKQKGDKKKPAFLTCSINLLMSNILGKNNIDYDPRNLTLITGKHFPEQVFSRRFDGAYPNTINPKCIWEIKEYYYTTTFGSRVADGVYETQLDGYELKDFRNISESDIYHFLAIDSHYTWWVCGKSYLCRLIDMLHMDLVNEIIFGREVLSRIPQIASNLLNQEIK